MLTFAPDFPSGRVEGHLGGDPRRHAGGGGLLRRQGRESDGDVPGPRQKAVDPRARVATRPSRQRACEHVSAEAEALMGVRQTGLGPTRVLFIQGYPWLWGFHGVGLACTKLSKDV